MAIEVDGKVLRNLQEQVLKNQEDILKIKQGLGDALPDPIAGPTGPTGATGPEGPRGPRGNGIYGCTAELPSPTAYIDGDLYVLFNGNVYKRILGKWVLQTNLKGPTGAVGPSGGSEVIANPVTAATDNLEKVTIDGTTYVILPNEQRAWLEDLYDNGFSWDSVNNWYRFDARAFIYNGAEVSDSDLEIVDNGAAIKLMGGLYQIVDDDDDPIVICENLNDANGNPRFVEGNPTTETISGVTFTYAKWSLSGSHLMCVLAGTIDNGVTLSLNTQLCSFPLANYIKNKIIPTVGNLIEYKTIQCVSSGYGTKNLNIYCDKTAGGIGIYVNGDFESDETYNFRLTIDLLIDME